MTQQSKFTDHLYIHKEGSGSMFCIFNSLANPEWEFLNMFKNNWNCSALFIKQVVGVCDWYLSEQQYIVDLINSYTKGRDLYLVGHSAGGSASIYYANKISNVVKVLGFSVQSSTAIRYNVDAPWVKYLISQSVPEVDYVNIASESKVPITILFDKLNCKKFDQLHIKRFQDKKVEITDYRVNNSEFAHRIPWDMKETGITRKVFEQIFNIL
jgi:hypothetical protein